MLPIPKLTIKALFKLAGVDWSLKHRNFLLLTEMCEVSWPHSQGRESEAPD